MNFAQQSRVSLIFITGQDEHGENMTRTKTLNNVKGSAVDEDLIDLVTTLTALQQLPLETAMRNNSYLLM